MRQSELLPVPTGKRLSFRAVTWLPVDASPSSERDSVLALQPEASGRWLAMLERSWAIADPDLLGLCSSRAAQVLECRAVLDYDADRLAEIADWRSTGSFASIERAALAYAEQFVVDQNGVRGEVEDDLLKHLSRRELCNFVQALNAHDGYMRAMSLLDVEPSGETSSIPKPKAASNGHPALIATDETEDLEALDLFAALTDPEFYARRSAFGATTALLSGVDAVTTEVCRLRNANHQACAF